MIETPPGLSREAFDTLLVRAVTQAQGAQSVTAVSLALPKAYRLPAEALKAALDRLAERKLLFVWPGKRRRYATVSWNNHVAARLLAALASGPKTAAQLALEVKTPRAAVDATLRRLIADGGVFRHPQLGQRRPFGMAPAEPLPYLRGGLEKLVAALTTKGFTREAIAAAIVKTLRGTAPVIAEADLLLHALERLEPQVQSGALVYIPHLRLAVADRIADRRTFDRLVLALATQRRVQVQTHPVPSQLTEAEREAMVPNGTGGFYMAIGLRRE